MGASPAENRRSWNSLLLGLGPLTVAVALLAHRAIAGVLLRVGHPGAPLDDAYIHFQYARALAEGHPLQFEAGAPVTSGCTSMLWPVLLAPFWALGARGEAILWPAWTLSFAALGALAWEAFHLTGRLAGRTAAVGAGAMTLSFGGFAWCAASGMEIVPFAWAIARTSRRAAEWAEGEPKAAGSGPRSLGRAAELIALAWISALLRPEGAIAALFACATLAAFSRTGSLRARGLALLPAIAAIAVPALLWVLTGSPRSTTAVAKLLPGNPYYVGASLTAAVVAHARLLVSSLLNGETWSAEFLPQSGAPMALAGLGAIAALGMRARARWRAAAVLLLALTMFAPCFYLTFLWNRLRYLWPFATGWIIGLACLARVVGDLLGLLGRHGRVATGIVCGTFAGLLASKIEWALDDVAQSASGIDRQQVSLGLWAKEHLPASARIGVNDTGAIAYFSNRDTFDIVGLTTRDEARYWVAGVASRFEHYERLHRRGSSELPTHFIVYPEWMALDTVLGEPLYEAVVTDATILGGRTMRAYAADWSKLGSGEEAWSHSGDVVDTLDVADLESEAAHEYELLGARDGEQTVREDLSPAGAVVVDGGRTRRTHESFIAQLPSGGAAAHGIVRIEGPKGTVVRVLANRTPADTFVLDDADGKWAERSFDIPAGAISPRTRVELFAEHGSVSVFHYWFVATR
jgi:hypothetical protein